MTLCLFTGRRVQLAHLLLSGGLPHIAKKQILYDFDDAIWINNTANPRIARFKKPQKTVHICNWASMVFVGNQYLADFASQYNNNVTVVPTTIDTQNHHNVIKDHHKNTPTHTLCIGWTGNHSTLAYLQDVEGVLRKIQDKHSIRIKIIADKAPQAFIALLTSKRGTYN